MVLTKVAKPVSILAADYLFKKTKREMCWKDILLLMVVFTTIFCAGCTFFADAIHGKNEGDSVGEFVITSDF